MELLNSSSDFHWYKQRLDAEGKYSYDHEGKPERYPCAVESHWYEPNADSPYTYAHRFYYQDQNECRCCGHVTIGWPEKVKTELGL